MKQTSGGNKPIGYEVDQLELEAVLDMSEIHELYRMAVRQMLQKVIMNMEESLVTQREAHTIQNGIIPKMSYSEILVYTGINKEPKEVVPMNIPTIITSRYIRKENKIHRLTPQKIEKNKIKSQVRRQKILLIGDSHVKGLSSELWHNLGDTYDILGIVKSNANINELTATCNQEVNKLTQKDFLALWGGTNDISKNNAKKCLMTKVNFLINNRHTNNIIITAPHRFNLEYNSCVNKDVRKFK
jgi:hypothetical protein